ncbi:MAG: hypothetical protein JSW39_19675 [Desulfobacterales bacterium]|nr:MAG: hypothetical protein JSW39_19675 [Desulfobacterales bacterium]
MSVKLEILSANDSLQNLQTAAQQTEALGFELITIARGVVSGQPANLLSLRKRTPGDAPRQLTLLEVGKSLSLQNQENKVKAEESDSKKLISYGAAFVQNEETMIAAYRG